MWTFRKKDDAPYCVSKASLRKGTQPMTDLINPANWGGAQWVLVTIWTMSIATYVGVRLAGMSKKDPIEWWGGFIGNVAGYATLFFILAWGGFWA